MSILKQYTLVMASDEPYRTKKWDGKDLREAIGISQAKEMPEQTYGWIQTQGEAMVRGVEEKAYIDFRPNDARLRIEGKWPIEEPPNPQSGQLEIERLKRLAQLPPLLVQNGEYCKLLAEARNVFVDRHFYACVAMCGITFEKLQRDKTSERGHRSTGDISKITKFLKRVKAFSEISLSICEKMARLRDKYAHAGGKNEREDALKALNWLHQFIEAETNLMNRYEVKNGCLEKKKVD